MKAQTAYILAGLALSAAGLASLSSGCELVSAVDRTKVTSSSGSGAGGDVSSTSSGHGGMGGHDMSGAGGAGGAGGGMMCTEADDCPATGNECMTADCVGMMCTTVNVEAGTLVGAQTAGDCQKLACDDKGAATQQPDDADKPDDSNECTDDTCNGGVEMNAPSAKDAACTVGGKFCDGLGACVECNANAQCSSGGVCQLGVCQAPGCGDGVLNGTETDKDCGGTCGGCGTGLICKLDADCKDKICMNLVCKAPSCSDLVTNGTESDTDCGGSDGCAKCAAGDDCTLNSDCAGASCMSLKCEPTCTDGELNNGETDVDCGGLKCNDCQNGDSCVSDSDCVDGYCNASKVCATPACDDTVKNGTETDVDCGGPVCPDKCADGDDCEDNTDCANGYCDAAKMCATPTCLDTVKNGAETGIDCGGPMCGDCANGMTCLSNDDCLSGMCYNAICVASINGCDIKNAVTTLDVTVPMSTTVNFPNANTTYAPKCIKTKVGNDVVFFSAASTFQSHPLQAGEVTTPGNMKVPSATGPFQPLTNTATGSKTFTMTTPGTYPYYCIPHGTIGMNGAVFVVP